MGETRVFVNKNKCRELDPSISRETPDMGDVVGTYIHTSFSTVVVLI